MKCGLSLSLALIAMIGTDVISTENKGVIVVAQMNELVGSKLISVGKIYRHYSGKLYKVLAIAHDSEDPNLLRVVYQGLYDCQTFGPNPVWVRPYTMFAEDVVINGKMVARFEEVVE